MGLPPPAEIDPDGQAVVALADATTGDTKTLNPGRDSLPTPVLRALAMARGIPLKSGAEARRELWDTFDVIIDDLTSRVLVLNLPATGQGLGQWLTDAARYGTPFHLTLHQLITLPIVPPAHHPSDRRGPANDVRL
ncbi:TIGR02679 domain-containing protein [Streptomyces sp. GbtcB6]|uniref:TIGR02679 domain-containing protein n=1 Tax=Streptomyces sp. GbtcB6 TaxID=2824751 RepID=UPI0020C60C94|nr:TIGR02679 domain-containing protein [Streptomyces sp. GbtcB6]